MLIRRMLRLAAVLVVGVAVAAAPASADAKPAKPKTAAKTAAKTAGKTGGKPAGKAKAKPSKGKKAKGKLVCRGKGKNRRCRRITGPIVHSWRPAVADLRTAPVPRPSGRIQIEVPALGEKFDVNIYNADGSYNQAVLAALDDLWICRKTKEIRAVDPRLYEVLSTIYDHYNKPVLLLSGFRFQRNEGSRHFHASAMDIRVSGVGYKDLYEYANSLDGGGMGIGQYPTMDFVHVDFRAPGEGSTRWIDKGVVNGKDPGKLPSRSWKRSKKPNT